MFARKALRSRQGGFILVGKGRAMLGGVDKDAAALIAQMPVKPSSQRQFLISNSIKSLKSSGVWSKLDALYMTAAHDSQAALLNWKNPGTWSLVATNSPTFTTDRGFKGDGATSYLTANGYNPSTAGGNYSQDSAVFGAWIQQACTTASGVDVGVSLTTRIGVTSGSGAYLVRVNDGTSLISSPNSVSTGHWAGRRLSSAGKDLWYGGAQYNAADAVASTSVGTALVIGALSPSSAFGNGRVAAAYTAGGLTDAQMAAMHAALQAYMQGVGAA